ncbi:MAG: UDP-N-acetylglucosamine diphosphorylase/glucosamine-1-phosphate N-acetyltransferase [Acidobacteria bacterium]|nr:MAG: UDP-N-acetylglucosamine diphosphorylase/glucosamine-1-phosphate N-acetyltransferase [Acidobacteriota bacterium]
MARPRIAIVIMAAGKGTRLKSKHPKVLHEVGGKPLLAYVIGAATQVAEPKDVFAIVGHEADRVRQAVSQSGINFVMQKPQKGTGHALMTAREALQPYDHIIVLSGDAPMITPDTIRKLRDFHVSQDPAMTILAAMLADPTGYGRVLRKGQNVQRVVEQRSATSQQLKIREINSGFYGFKVKSLFRHIDKLSTNNPHGEFYLTDMAEILSRSKEHVLSVNVDNPAEILGANSRTELVEIDQRMRTAKCHELMAEGVTIFNPSSCVIDADVLVGSDTVIEPFVQIRGNTHIGSDVRIGSFSVISNCEIGDQVNVQTGCVLEDSHIGNRAGLGPYSHVRPGCEICEEAHVGNFVEMKKTRLGRASKANHLTYLGDSDVGEEVNVGAGTITCNYDGIHKHKTVIEDGVFIGSDSILVAPIRIGKGAYVAAGSCLTDDVPPESLALGRARQVIKESWARQKRAGRAAKKAE